MQTSQAKHRTEQNVVLTILRLYDLSADHCFLKGLHYQTGREVIF